MVGPWLAFAVVLGGMLNGAGMFNALMMSYARVPYALAQDGLLPRFLTRTTSAGVPWPSVLVCALAWALALRLSFERLISIDLVLYGASLLLLILGPGRPAPARACPWWPFRLPEAFPPPSPPESVLPSSLPSRSTPLAMSASVRCRSRLRRGSRCRGSICLPARSTQCAPNRILLSSKKPR